MSARRRHLSVSTHSKNYLLGFLLLMPGCTTCSAAHQELPAVLEQPVTIPPVRTKILAEGYAQLCDAIDRDDITAVRSLFGEFPGLAAFSYQQVGSPLHFVRSVAMTKFLVEEAKISASFCDEWGETPSSAITQSKADRFPSEIEQKAISRYLKKHERFLAKLGNQLLGNKQLQMKLSVAAMGTIMAVNLAVLIEIFLIKYKTLQGAY